MASRKAGSPERVSDRAEAGSRQIYELARKYDRDSAYNYINSRNVRGVAQLVARTAGGREVASSSLVIPTIIKSLSQ